MKKLFSRKLLAFVVYLIVEFVNKKYGVGIDSGALAGTTSAYVIGQAVVDAFAKAK